MAVGNAEPEKNKAKIAVSHLPAAGLVPFIFSPGACSQFTAQLFSDRPRLSELYSK
jgi:hypothetical protein